MAISSPPRPRTGARLLFPVLVASFILASPGCITTAIHSGEAKHIALASAIQIGVGVGLGLGMNMCPEEDHASCLDEEGSHVNTANMSVALLSTVGIDLLAAFVLWAERGMRKWNMGSSQ